MEKKAETSVPVDDLLSRRWSPRAFEPDKKITREQVMALIEAARWAPSCFNDQPWAFIFWNRHGNRFDWERAFACLSDWNRGWVINAPLLLVSLARSKFHHNGKPNRHAQYDTGAASENICLQATSMGLMAHQMAGFDAGRLMEEFGIPGEYTPMAMIAVGYQADPDILEGKYREQEIQPRKRSPVNINFFDSEWERAYEI